jgi:hypothetical protein
MPVIALFVFPPKLTKRNILLIAMGVFSLLFSLGDATPFRKLCYDVIPLMNTFRHPSQARLYVILALLLLAATGLKKMLAGYVSRNEYARLKWVLWTQAGITLIITLISLIGSDYWSNTSIRNTGGLTNRIKSMLESVSFNDSVALNGLLQLGFILLFVLFYKKIIRSTSFMIAFSVANLFVMAQLVLPATFVGKVSPSVINKMIRAAPPGFPSRNLSNTLKENSVDADNSFDTIGLYTFYNKKIGISHITNSPAFLAQQDSFVNSPSLYEYVANRPVVYIADTIVKVKDSSDVAGYACDVAFGNTMILSNDCNSKSDAWIRALNSNTIVVGTSSHKPGLLVLAQNYHHDWTVTIDGQPGTIQKVNLSFIGTMLPEGDHTVYFRFRPWRTMYALWIQLGVVLCLVAGGLVTIFKKRVY